MPPRTTKIKLDDDLKNQMADLGARVTMVRKLKHISQRELADSIGVSVPTIGRIEQGMGVKTSLDTVIKLSEKLNTPIEILLKNLGSGEFKLW